jgi:hypothetical protein
MSWRQLSCDVRQLTKFETALRAKPRSRMMTGEKRAEVSTGCTIKPLTKRVQRRDNTHVHEHESPCTPVLEGLVDVDPVEAEVDVGDTLTRCKAMLPLASFQRSQELLLVFGKVDEVLEGEKGNENSEDLRSVTRVKESAYTLKKEDPAPTLKTSNTLHLTDTVCESATESSGQCGACKEDGLRVRTF